jgi:hypothetical protein
LSTLFYIRKGEEALVVLLHVSTPRSLIPVLSNADSSSPKGSELCRNIASRYGYTPPSKYPLEQKRYSRTHFHTKIAAPEPYVPARSTLGDSNSIPVSTASPQYIKGNACPNALQYALQHPLIYTDRFSTTTGLDNRNDKIRS